jgi:hypothetical protein
MNTGMVHAFFKAVQLGEVNEVQRMLNNSPSLLDAIYGSEVKIHTHEK